jgi:uncharacterized membrane protein
MSDLDQSAQPAPRADLGEGPAPAAAAAPVSASSFDFNHPTIISLLYLSSVVLGVTAIVGVVLAYVWKGEAHADWESSHYQYLIRTFWIGLIGSLVSVLFMIVLIGFLMLVAVGVLVLVRCVMSLVAAQKQQPMPNPTSLFV